MPTTTPTTWLDSIQVNTSATGFQGHQQIVGLSNGNILVVFADDSGTVGSGSGRDIVGVIYDAEGTIVRTAFQVNTSFSVDAEESPSIAATNDGGFVMAYEDRDAGGQSIRLERFDAGGIQIDSATVQSDPGTPLVSRPRVTVDQFDNSVFVSYLWSDGNNDSLRGKALDANLNIAAGTPATGHVLRTDDRPGDGVGVFNQETAVLTNGNYVTVFQEPDTASADSYNIEFRISDGTTGANGTVDNVTSGTAPGEFTPDVAALTGGGFVVVWREDESTNDNIKFARFNSAGTLQGTITTVVDTGNNYIQPRVIGLEDGGFFVLAYDATADALEGTRYSATGVQIGSNMFSIENGVTNTPDPQLSLTTDGRILVTWDDPAGNIQMEILDPRDAETITGDPGDGQITAGLGNSTVTGSSSNETIWGQGGDDLITPGLGNDFVYGGFGIDTIDLGTSIDGSVIQIFANRWEASTSSGLDTIFEAEIVWFTEGAVELANPSNSGLVFVTSSAGGEFIRGGETYVGPVNYLERELLLSSLDENVIGTAGNDFVNSFGGVDGIDAKGGDDVLDGGTDSNFLTGGTGVDIFFTDARIPGLTTWSTITDFDPSVEEATIWGWQPGISSGQWVASDGAVGFQGATFHADVDGNGIIDTSITFTGLAQNQVQQPLELDGLLWFL